MTHGSISLGERLARGLYSRQYAGDVEVLAARIQAAAYGALNGEEPVINHVFQGEDNFDQLFGTVEDQGPLGELLRGTFRGAPPTYNSDVADGPGLTLGMIIERPASVGARPIVDFYIAMMPLDILWSVSQFWVSNPLRDCM